MLGEAQLDKSKMSCIQLVGLITAMSQLPLHRKSIHDLQMR